MELIQSLGFPIACCVVLGYAIREIFFNYIEALKTEIYDLKDITIKLIDSNNELRNKLLECTSDLKTIIEFVKENG